MEGQINSFNKKPGKLLWHPRLLKIYIQFLIKPSGVTLKPAPHKRPSRRTLMKAPHECSPSKSLITRLLSGYDENNLAIR